MSMVGTQEIAAKSPPTFTTATVGKKILMAVSGLVIISFVIVHLIGNLQIFMGPAQLNKYAETLQNLGALKWGFRIFMLVFFLTHVWKGIVLWLENNKARPVSYIKTNSEKATFASKTMIYTGAMIFCFVILHLWHFTISPVHPVGGLNVYNMVVKGFQNPYYSGFYLLTMLLMAFHLSHALSSLFQTLGLNKASILPKLKIMANIVAWVIFLAYASIPASVLLGLVKTVEGGH